MASHLKKMYTSLEWASDYLLQSIDGNDEDKVRILNLSIDRAKKLDAITDRFLLEVEIEEALSFLNAFFSKFTRILISKNDMPKEFFNSKITQIDKEK